MTVDHDSTLGYQPLLRSSTNPSKPVEALRRTPKRPRDETAGLADVFPYYAGFSFDWARDQLRLTTTNRSAVVLDPWNGSGTTTLAAASNGHRTIGVDLNPMANLVARLRSQAGKVAKFCDPPPSQAAIEFNPNDDPLLAWLTPETTFRFREWSAHLQRVPADLRTLGYVSLFRVVRKLTRRFEGTNPTWVRRAAIPGDRVDVASQTLDQMLVDDQRALLQRLIDWAPPRQGICLLTASASRLPLADESVDTILASPPYLTRIDYAAAYARELAIMGFDIARDRTLRETLMGTTLIRSSDHNHNGSSYGPLALSLVRQVGEHESKASAGYYLKQVRQYLDDLAASLREISRVAKMGAMMTLVVQDSYYKDIHIPLAQICIEQAEKQGWNLNSLAPKEVSRILTHMNTAARKYPKGRVNESVVVLKKERERG